MATSTIWQVIVEQDRQWCNQCNTSSLTTIDSYLIPESPKGLLVSVRHQGQGRHCTTCDPDEEG